MRKALSLFSGMALMLGAPAAQAATISYTGADGASATAVYTLVNATQLTIRLTNTSVSPFNGGDTPSAITSLNIDLPTGVNIIGGSVALAPGSTAVTKQGNAWVTTSVNLNAEFAYANNGIGNNGPYAGALNAITSHTNGGNGAGLVRFDGTPGAGATNGPPPGIIATGTAPFGGNTWIRNSLIFTISLSSGIQNLDFLKNGTYVEFGSDAQFVPGGGCTGLDCPVLDPCTDRGCTPVPEPTTMALLGVGLLGAGIVGRRRR